LMLLDKPGQKTDVSVVAEEGGVLYSVFWTELPTK
jgi:hypothetical protein